MKGYIGNIEDLAISNTNFRTVLYTSKSQQLVLMAIAPGGDIGVEVHTESDQFFRFESGQGSVIIDGVAHEVAGGSAVIVPAGAKHNVINTNQSEVLKLYTIYSPPHHQDGVVHKTKAEALSDEEK